MLILYADKSKFCHELFSHERSNLLVPMKAVVVVVLVVVEAARQKMKHSQIHKKRCAGVTHDMKQQTFAHDDSGNLPLQVHQSDQIADLVDHSVN